MSPFDSPRTAYPVTQAQIAYNELRRAITSGELPGGAHIVQSEWADRIDVSITPIREAIRRLEQDGLARSEAHKGTTVTKLSFEGASEIYALRQVVDPLQLKKSQGHIAGTIDQARELCVDMNVRTDPVEFCDLDLRFHCIIMGLDDSWTSRMARYLLVAASPYVTILLAAKPSLMAKSNEDHFRMIEAVEANDTEKMVRLHTQHLTEMMTALGDVSFPISANKSAPQ